MQNFGTQKRYESCHDNHVMISHELCYEGINTLTICHDSNCSSKQVTSQVSEQVNRINKDEWQYLIETLESWRVFSPRAVVKKNPAAAWKCMNLCKDKGVRVPGAYFTACFRRELAKAQAKNVVSRLEEKLGVA